MDKQELIKQIETARNSRLIIYITGDRQPFATKIADDVIPLFNNHLEKFNSPNKISLFLYTRGGDMITPVRLIKLIRSYCKKLEILIPYRAHSAGTLIALGADKIVMGKLAELSPVDPSTGHPFNPSNPTNPQQRLEVSVEDLNSYFMVAKEMAGVKEENMGDVFKHLADKLHPLSIGNAYRAYRMARILVNNILKIHMDNESKIKKINQALTSDICIHGYPITRDEAAGLGLKVEKATSETEAMLWNLYKYYAESMELDVPFNPVEIIGDKDTLDFNYSTAYIDTSELSYSFKIQGKIQKIIREGKPFIDLQVGSSRWGIN